jgi:hypothetical protein
MKMCNICGSEKSKEFFHKSKNESDGLKRTCKECRKIESKQRYKKHKAYILNKASEYQKGHGREAHNRANKRYREKQIEENPFRVCSRCGTKKNISDFYRKKERYSVCNACREQAIEENRIKNINRATVYYNENKERYRSSRAKKYRSDVALSLWRSAKYRAKKRGIEFCIKKRDVYVPDKCPVLGVDLVVSRGHVKPNSPTIDRIDPQKGYIKGNIIVVSSKANTIKSNATVKELEMVYGFYKNLS